MHYWRAPVPDMWIDILQKIKAAGYIKQDNRVVMQY
jgi:hypothetical protein